MNNTRRLIELLIYMVLNLSKQVKPCQDRIYTKNTGCIPSKHIFILKSLPAELKNNILINKFKNLIHSLNGNTENHQIAQKLQPTILLLINLIEGLNAHHFTQKSVLTHKNINLLIYLFHFCCNPKVSKLVNESLSKIKPNEIKKPYILNINKLSAFLFRFCSAFKPYNTIAAKISSTASQYNQSLAGIPASTVTTPVSDDFPIEIIYYIIDFLSPPSTFVASWLAPQQMARAEYTYNFNPEPIKGKLDKTSVITLSPSCTHIMMGKSIKQINYHSSSFFNTIKLEYFHASSFFNTQENTKKPIKTFKLDHSGDNSIECIGPDLFQSGVVVQNIRTGKSVSLPPNKYQVPAIYCNTTNRLYAATLVNKCNPNHVSLVELDPDNPEKTRSRQDYFLPVPNRSYKPEYTDFLSPTLVFVTYLKPQNLFEQYLTYVYQWKVDEDGVRVATSIGKPERFFVLYKISKNKKLIPLWKKELNFWNSYEFPRASFSIISRGNFVIFYIAERIYVINSLNGKVCLYRKFDETESLNHSFLDANISCCGRYFVLVHQRRRGKFTLEFFMNIQNNFVKLWQQEIDEYIISLKAHFLTHNYHLSGQLLLICEVDFHRKFYLTFNLFEKIAN